MGNYKDQLGPKGPNWRGGVRRVRADGYIYAYVPNASKKMEHTQIAERVLGKPLPKGVQIHHADDDGTNNTHGNLVICQDQKYHALLHMRQRALDACGHASWRKCWICKKYDDPKNLYIGKESAFHRACSNARYHAQKLVKAP